MQNRYENAPEWDRKQRKICHGLTWMDFSYENFPFSFIECGECTHCDRNLYAGISYTQKQSKFHNSLHKERCEYTDELILSMPKLKICF